MFDQGTLAAPKGIDPPLLGANPTLADSNAIAVPPAVKANISLNGTCMWVSPSSSNINFLFCKYKSLCPCNEPTCISDVGLFDVSNKVVPVVTVPAVNCPESVTELHCLHLAST